MNAEVSRMNLKQLKEFKIELDDIIIEKERIESFKGFISSVNYAKKNITLNKLEMIGGLINKGEQIFKKKSRLEQYDIYWSCGRIHQLLTRQWDIDEALEEYRYSFRTDYPEPIIVDELEGFIHNYK